MHFSNNKLTVFNFSYINGIYIKFSDNCRQYIIDAAFSYDYGARPLKRFIQKEVETLLGRAIISGQVDTKSSYVVDVANNQFVIRK